MENEAAISWGQTHFGGLALGDARRSQRLPELMDAMRRHPGGTLPDKLSHPPDLRAFYRLMDAEEVTHAAVLAKHFRLTGESIAKVVNEGGTALIVHDATELDYTSKTTLVDHLGQIGRGTQRGYICHNSLAVRADTKEALGLTSQILHHRADAPKKETGKQRRERESRESRLWPQSARQSGPASPTGRVIDVSDSLSDTFEYMAYEMSAGRWFVLRAKENRKLVKSIHTQEYLFDAVRSCRSVDEWDLHVPAGPGRSKRTAHLHLSFTPVTLALPHERSGDYPSQPLELWAVRIWEPKPPSDVEPLEWILLTNVETTTAEGGPTRG